MTPEEEKAELVRTGEVVQARLTGNALERLCGANPDLRLHLTQQICGQFLRHRLKEVLDSDLYTKLKNELQAELHRELNAAVGVKPGSTYNAVWGTVMNDHNVHTEVKERIQHFVQKVIEEQLTERIKLLISQNEARLTEIVRKHFETHLNDQVRGKIQQMVDERLRTWLTPELLGRLIDVRVNDKVTELAVAELAQRKEKYQKQEEACQKSFGTSEPAQSKTLTVSPAS
jgi:hypothetical protein